MYETAELEENSARVSRLFSLVAVDPLSRCASIT